MAVLLDSNVVSELIREAPDPDVERWVAGHPLEELYFSAIGEAELRYGAAIRPAGRRRETLVSNIERMLHVAFESRILPFDSPAARAFAEIAAGRRGAGRPIGETDCRIAAIARSRDLALATRNIRDFQGTGIELANPWAAA